MLASVLSSCTSNATPPCCRDLSLVHPTKLFFVARGNALDCLREAQQHPLRAMPILAQATWRD